MTPRIRFVAAVLLFGLVWGCSDETEPVTEPWPIVLEPPTATASDAAPPGDPDWHRKVVFYELWVRSFQDSTGDGIGDFQGLIERLDYLEDLGVGGIWLMPIHPSPLADSGYDVADYEEIHEDYGTLADFDAFLEAAHARNLRVFVDLVFNHTSDQHEWFLDSRTNPTGTHGDWYLWADEPGLGCDNSLPGFGDERWTWDETRGQYYFHQFYPGQPELNFDSLPMQDALLDVMRYWLDRGVDGFRLDVANRYHDVLPQCADTAETHAYHRRMREVTDEYSARAMVGEVTGGPEIMVQNFGTGTDALHMVFNIYGIINHRLALSSGTVEAVQSMIDTLVALTPEGSVHAEVLGNHDVQRLSDGVGRDVALMKLGATTLMTLPGVPFVYYGEEIGMPNGPEWVIDSRDKARTPMQWDTSPTGGFTTGTPWLALAGELETWSVGAQQGVADSLLSHYERLIAMRNGVPALQTGSYEPLDVADLHLYAVVRRHATGDRLVLLHYGFDPVTLELPLPEPFASAPLLADEISLRQVGPVEGGVLRATLPPTTGLVIRTVD